MGGVSWGEASPGSVLFLTCMSLNQHSARHCWVAAAEHCQRHASAEQATLDDRCGVDDGESRVISHAGH